MGAHERPTYGIGAARSRHRGHAEARVDLDVSAVATRAGVVLAAAGAAASVMVAGAGGAAAASPRTATPSQFAALRMCESSGDYAINTGNGYYGAYQFSLGTWDGLGYSGLPSAAAPATQDQAAERLQAARGWEPWPACAAKLGLNSTSAPVFTPTPTRIELTSPTRVHVAAIVYPAFSRAGAAHRITRAPAARVPAFDGTVLTVALEPVARADVRTWQARMVARGWHLSVDGSFGPQSAAVAREFAAQKGVAAEPGTVNAAMWWAAWTAPITP